MRSARALARPRAAGARDGRPTAALALLLPFLLAATAQETKPAKILAVRVGRVLTLAGDGLGAIEKGVVLIEDGKITAVGADLEIPAGAEVIEVAGATAAPGFFDARSALPLDPGALGEGRDSATLDVLDAIDPYAVDAIAEALRNGVTAVQVEPGRGATIAGRTAVLKLKPGRPVADAVVKRGNGMRGSIGASRGAPSGPFARIAEVRSLREQLRGAKKYREAWEDYREALKEYEEEKAKRAKEGPESKPSGEKAEEKKEPAAETRPSDGRRRIRPPRDVDEEFGEDPDPAAALQEKKEEPKAEEKKEEKAPLKKPDKPALERDKEILLEVIEGKMPLRIEAHRAEDILNLLRVTDEFGVDFVLEGGTEAARIAPELKKRDVPVVLGPPHVGGDAPPEFEANDPAIAAKLRAGGVRIAIGSSGTDSAETRFVSLQAAAAAAAGLDPVAALRAVTIDAATLCGVGDRLGSLAKGKDGDLVVFDGDPLATSSKVLLVIVDGEVVWRR